MFDIGWTELLIIGVVALIVVGPKDLPGMFRALGRFTAKMRSLAREFQRAMNQAAEESGVSDVASDLKALRSAKSLGLDAVQDAANRFKGGWKSGLEQPAEASGTKEQPETAIGNAAAEEAGSSYRNSAPASKESSRSAVAAKAESAANLKETGQEAERSSGPDDAKAGTAPKADG